MAIAPVTSIRPVARTDSPAKKGVGDGIGARQEQKAEEELGFFDKVSNLFTLLGGKALQQGKPEKPDNRTLHMEVYKEMDMQDEARRSAEQARATSTSTRSLTGEEWGQRYQPAYTVQSGDNLSKIARENNTTVEALLEVNPSITNPNQLSVSQAITLPTSDAAVVRPANAGIMSAPVADAAIEQPFTLEHSFDTTSVRLVKDLMNDFGLTSWQAAAIAGNLAVETDRFNALQEYKPVVEGSRGGFGFAQWTGPRRRAFEKWTEENSLDPTSYEANYGYLKHEFTTVLPDTIGRIGINTIQRIKNTANINAATDLVRTYYLKPGVAHTNKRRSFAQEILQMVQ